MTQSGGLGKVVQEAARAADRQVGVQDALLIGFASCELHVTVPIATNCWDRCGT